VTDGIDVFQGLYPLFELGQSGTLAVLWHGHEVPPRWGPYDRRRGMRPSVHPTSRQTRSAPYRITTASTRGFGSTCRLERSPVSCVPRPDAGGMQQSLSFVQCFGASQIPALPPIIAPMAQITR
jgi:hypothetical protein